MKINPPWLHDADLLKLMQALEKEGEFRFVGGCVRDTLLNTVQKDVDIDIAVPYPPEKTLAILEKNGIKAVPTGLKFGTITAVMGHKHFEITSLRNDIETDGRHATVHYTTSFKEDALRRDLTINALFMDKGGHIDDYVGGLQDLQTGTIRFVGDAFTRMMEDHLRMLRLFRFWAFFGKIPLDKTILSACQKIASLLTKLSKERVQKELFKTLEAPKAPEIFHLIFEHGFFKDLFPFLKSAQMLENLHKSPFQHNHDLHLNLCALCGSSENTHKLIEALKLSKYDQKNLKKLWQSVSMLQKHTIGEVLKLQTEEGVDLTKKALILLALSHPQSEEFTQLHFYKLPYALKPFPITAKDLMKKGIKDKALGETLTKIKQWWYDAEGKPNKDKCLHFLETLKD